MSRRLAVALACAALGACSAPTGKTCTRTAECGAGNVCSAGFCQVAIDTAISNGPATAVASASASFDFSSTPAGAAFECSVDGASFASCPAHHVLTGLGDGPHTLDVRARSAENLDATPARWSWTVDTTPPDTSVITGPSGVSTGAVSFTFSSPEASATFECSLDAGAWAACASPLSYPTPALGPHTLQVRARDPLGNVDATPSERAWSTAAGTTITARPASAVASPSASFSFSASNAAATFECRLDTEPAFSPCTSPKSYIGLGDGSHTFQVRAVGAGVADPAPPAYTWTVDTTGPAVNLTGYPLDPQSEDPSFAFSSPEATATFECRLDGGGFTPCTSPAAYTGLSVGSHTFYVRGRDVLGNATATPAQYAWRQAPETRITWAPLPWTNRTAERLAFTSPAPGATFRCQLDSGPWTDCTSPWSVAVTSGARTVSVRATASALEDPTPATTTFTVSTTNALLYYNFEGSGANDSQLLSGYGATLSGAAAYSTAWSHGLTGLSSASLAASAYGVPSPVNQGEITLAGVASVLDHDFDPIDARYTIAFWFYEHDPANVQSNSVGFFPTIFSTRYQSGSVPGAGVEVYHGVYAPPAWTVCWSSTPPPTGNTCSSLPAVTSTGAAHRMVIEYAYDGANARFDVGLYVDPPGVLSVTTSTAPGAGQVIFNALMTDPVLGKDWNGYIDDLRIWNTTFPSHTPP